MINAIFTIKILSLECLECLKQIISHDDLFVLISLEYVNKMMKFQ